MIVIKHRVNSVEDLKKTPTKYGVEIDLRSYGQKIIVDHEPFRKSITFNKWLKFYNHKFLILNTKEERIEIKILKLLVQNKIKNYFFLDSTIPMIHTLNQKNFFKIALRVSHYESHLKYFNLIKKNIKNEWLWLDTIDGNIPLKLEELKKLKKLGYKICLVSPELPLKKKANINKFEKKYYKFLDYVDAVCTKKINFWNKYEN
tara:strand:- start:152 stop:760 length:609 start_codon:yes stop_codon:yes gene_type:complete